MDGILILNVGPYDCGSVGKVGGEQRQATEVANLGQILQDPSQKYFTVCLGDERSLLDEVVADEVQTHQETV